MVGCNGEWILGEHVEGDVPSAVLFFDLRGLTAAGGDDSALMSALNQFAAQFDGAAFDSALIQFWKYLYNVHEREVISYALSVISYFKRYS